MQNACNSSSLMNSIWKSIFNKTITEEAMQIKSQILGALVSSGSMTATQMINDRFKLETSWTAMYTIKNATIRSMWISANLQMMLKRFCL